MKSTYVNPSPLHTLLSHINSAPATMTARIDGGEPFLKHLNVSKTPYIFITAETDDFDEEILAAWQGEGFVTTYVPYGDGGREYINRMHAAPDQALGLNDQYAIVGSFFPPLPSSGTEPQS